MRNLKILNVKKSFQIILGIVLTLAILVVFSISQFNLIKTKVDNILIDNNVEDFHYLEKYSEGIKDEEIESLKTDGIILEKNEYVTTEDNFVLFMENKNNLINKVHLESGEFPTTDDEIVLATNFSKEKYEIGDQISINQKSYTISGFGIFPNYVTPFLNTQVNAQTEENIAKVGLIKNLPINIEKEVYVAVESNKEEQEVKEAITKFTSNKEEIFNNPYISEEQKNDIAISGTADGIFLFTNAKNNIRIIEYEQEFSQINNILKFLLLGIVYSVLILIYLYIQYTKEKNIKNIGILYSLGYKNSKVTLLFITPIVITIAVSCLVATFIYLIFLKDAIDALIFQMLNINLIFMDMNLLLSSLLVLIPFIIVLCLIMISIVNKHQISDLIRENIKTEKNLSFLKIKNSFFKLKVMEYFKINKYVIIILISILTISITISFLFINTYYTLYSDIGSKSLLYNNAVYYENIKDSDDEDDFLTIRTQMRGKTNDNIQIYGINKNTEFINLFDYKTGENINDKLEDGIVINKYLSVKYDYNIGDSIKILNNKNNEEVDLKVVGINSIPWHNFAYTTNENLTGIIGIPDGSTNSSFTIKQESKIIKDGVAFIENKQELVNSFKNKVKIYIIISFLSILINFVLIVSIFLYIIKINVQRNKKEISLLASLGYKNNTIYNTIISTYLLDVIISAVISTFITFIIYSITVSKMIDTSSVLPPNNFNIWIHIGVVFLFIALYIIISKTLQSNISKVDIALSLKDD